MLIVSLTVLNSLPSPGTGYFVRPSDDTPGPGVLLIPSPWGLTPSLKEKADQLADAGFTVLAPDMNDGETASNADDAHRLLLETDINVTASLVQSSLRLLQAASPDRTAPVGLLGYAAGASWALWLSVRFPDQCAAVATFYGAQTIPFDGSHSSYLLHFAEHDDDVSDEDQAMMGLNMQLAKCDFRVEVHPGVRSGFAEAAHPNFDGSAEAVAWRQTLEFLASALKP